MNKNDEYIGKIFGNYKITKFIVNGGMNSLIYEANAIDLDKNNYFDSKIQKAAIKIIKKSKEIEDDVWHRIYDEVVTLSRMWHKKNVIKFFDSLVDENQIVIIMEFADGASLEQKILEYGHFSLEESIYLFKEILKGVRGLHENSFSIIHRDLKPANILLLKNQTEIRIIDFGISSVFDRTISKEKPIVVTNEENLFGTLTYVCPDIIGSHNIEKKELYKKITKQFDFHSLGIIFHEMLTGEKPFFYENENDPKCLEYFLNYDFLPLKWHNPLIPNSIENIIFKLTASKKEYKKFRYNNVNEILSDVWMSEKKIPVNINDQELILPINKRVFQFNVPFNLNLEIKKGNLNKKYIYFYFFLSLISFALFIFCVIWNLVVNG